MIDRQSPQKKPRAQRLSAALRENLLRRKAQARGRMEADKDERLAAGPAQEPRPHDSAGIIEKK